MLERFIGDSADPGLSGWVSVSDLFTVGTGLAPDGRTSRRFLSNMAPGTGTQA